MHKRAHRPSARDLKICVVPLVQHPLKLHYKSIPIMPSSKVSKTSQTTKTTSKVTKSSAPKQVKKTEKPVETTTAKNTETSTEATAVVSPVIQQIDLIQQEVIALSTQLRGLTNKLKQVKKEHAKNIKQLQKLQKKKKSGGSGVKHQSGIAKPGFISPELCDFIGVSAGTEMARTEVIKYVNKYIKEHQLQDQANKKVIVPDAKLQSLLQSSKNDEITYFNLQTYMKPHYANPNKTASVVA